MKKVTVTYEIEDGYDEKVFLSDFKGDSYRMILSELSETLIRLLKGKGWSAAYDCDYDLSDVEIKLIKNIQELIGDLKYQYIEIDSE